MPRGDDGASWSLGRSVPRPAEQPDVRLPEHGGPRRGGDRPDAPPGRLRPAHRADCQGPVRGFERLAGVHR